MTHWISVLVCISQNRRIKYSPRMLLKCFIPHFLKEKSMISLEVARHVWLLEENIIRYICLFLWSNEKIRKRQSKSLFEFFSHLFQSENTFNRNHPWYKEAKLMKKITRAMGFFLQNHIKDNTTIFHGYLFGDNTSNVVFNVLLYPILFRHNYVNTLTSNL